MLKSELTIINQTAVITWGKESENAINQANLGIKHITYPHPSGLAAKSWEKIMGKPATRTNKLEFWKESITEKLKG